MSPRRFDRVMVHVDIAHHLKLRRLSDGEFKAFLVGVLPIAAKSDIRGALLIGNHPAGPEDIAHQARISKRVAATAMRKLRDVGMLEHDDELGAEWVHDFDEWNPEPRTDSTAAERAARYRAKQKARRDVTRDGLGASRRDGRDDHGNVTPTEVEGEEKPPPTPPGGATVTNGDGTAADLAKAQERLRRERAAEQFADWLTDHTTTTGHTPPREGTQARAALLSAFSARLDEGYTLNELKLATRGARADDYRREHGYDRAESVLRPRKVHDLIERGRRGTASPEPSMVDVLNWRPLA
jgi:hypothetical protein